MSCAIKRLHFLRLFAKFAANNNAHGLSNCLLPLSGVYRSIVLLRRLWYRSLWGKITYFDVPVIVVGNITVGGTGKTPLVASLVEKLRAAGFHPGIVSRGYGAKIKYPTIVHTNHTPQEVGDEPLMLAQVTNAPVVVCPDRVQAAATLLTKFQCDVVISDDGLQHYRLGRSFEIAVIDGECGFGNARCLPAGPLREPVKRLNTVDAIVVNGEPLFNMGARQYWEMKLVHEPFCSLADSSREFPCHSHVIHAVAGIGNPQRFFTALKTLGFELIEHAFPDHHPYQATDLDFSDDLPIVMTQKDAVKCRAFAHERMWYLPVKAELHDDFYATILNRLDKNLKKENKHG